MKKLIPAVFFILITARTAFASSSQFDRVLYEKIGEYGIFSGGEGIVYADEKRFEGRDSLFIVRTASGSIICEAYDDSDGIQLSDTLEFPCGGKNTYKLASVSKDGTDYIMMSSSSGGKAMQEYFTMQNDSFTKVNLENYSNTTYIVGYEKGKAVPYVKTQNVFRFLNTLKERTIAQYPFVNSVNTISEEEAQEIKKTIVSCADVMSFDIKDYEYDTLFKYILYTHKNFTLLTDLPPLSGNSSSLGYNNVSIVSSSFIDYILENVFRVTPQKPPVNSLLSRGFCYNNGYYYYTGGFGSSFSTEVRDLIGVYDIGGSTFVVFSDIYSENGSDTPEYSFAILQKSDGIYSVLRLGMGENLPDADEIKEYSPLAATPSPPPEKPEGKSLTMPVLLLIFSVGTIGLIFGIIALIKSRKKID